MNAAVEAFKIHDAQQSVGMFALEAKVPWDEIWRQTLEASARLPMEEPALDEREGLFFLRQCITACEHLTEVQHCNVDTIEYAGVHNGRHVWMART